MISDTLKTAYGIAVAVGLALNLAALTSLHADLVAIRTQLATVIDRSVELVDNTAGIMVLEAHKMRRDGHQIQLMPAPKPGIFNHLNGNLVE